MPINQRFQSFQRSCWRFAVSLFPFLTYTNAEIMPTMPTFEDSEKYIQGIVIAGLLGQKSLWLVGLDYAKKMTV